MLFLLRREVLGPTGTVWLTQTCSRSRCPLHFVTGHEIEPTVCFALHAEQPEGIAMVVGLSGWLVMQLKSGKIQSSLLCTQRQHCEFSQQFSLERQQGALWQHTIHVLSSLWIWPSEINHQLSVINVERASKSNSSNKMKKSKSLWRHLVHVC